MQIQFDPRDRNACGSVMAAILALHPDLARIGTEFEKLPDAPSPAEAFDGASAQDAFGAGPTARPTADTAAAPAGSTPTPPLAPAPANSPNGASDAAAPSGGNGAGGASPNPGNVEVDKSGLPWDGRIHSGPADKRPQNADGTWRKRRGVSDDEVAAVEAELRAALNAPAAGAVPTPPAPPAAPAAPVAPIAEAPAAPIPPAPPAAPAAPLPTAAPTPTQTPPSPPSADAGTVPTSAQSVGSPSAATPAPSAPAGNFAELMRKITSLQAAGTLTVEGTAEISAALGISGVRDLITRPDLVPSFDALLPVAA